MLAVVPLDLPGPVLRPDLLAAGYTDEELRRARRTGEVVPSAEVRTSPSTGPRLDDVDVVAARLRRAFDPR
jgi:hypothetical protein